MKTKHSFPNISLVKAKISNIFRNEKNMEATNIEYSLIPKRE
jgi:hypothetical protein